MLRHVIDSLLRISSGQESEVCCEVFHMVELPEITLDRYIRRIQRFTGYETNVFVQALIYVERLATLGLVTQHTVHRIAGTAISLSSKILLDRPIANKAYASRRCSGLGNLLCQMECKVLDVMDYRIIVEREEFEKKIDLLNY